METDKLRKGDSFWIKLVSTGNFDDKMRAYLRIHMHGLFSSLGRLMLSPFTTLMTTSVLAIAIALVGGFYILVANVQQLTGNLRTSNQISIFLKQEVTDRDGEKLAEKLNEHVAIQSIKLITKQQALQEFQTYSGFGDALKALESNPLPVVIQVFPEADVTTAAKMQQLMAYLEANPEVNFAQIDMQWVKRLQSIIQLARRGVGLLSLLLGFAVLFITGNTIRLELHNRREEVVIAKLVGATNAFIQRPFLYSGFWYGFFAGAVAWLIVTGMMLILQSPVEKLSALYAGNFQILFLSFSESLLLLIISSCLAILGAKIVLGFQLQHLEPE